MCWDEKWNEEWDMELLILKEWIELLRMWIWDCDDLDWIVEICELHVFDGNELVVLDGWLICGKPRKKERLILKKMPRKGKWLI